MNWIAANCIAFLVIALIAFVLYRRAEKESTARTWCGRCALTSFVLALAGGGWLLFAAPGLDDTEKEREGDRAKPIAKHIDRLRSAWDSEGKAAWPVAETLALFCQTAYQPPVDARDSFLKLGVDSVETIVDGSMVGYVIAIADVAVVVFRGTDDNFDWFCNLNSLTTPTPQGPIHRGFLQSYRPLKPQITKLLGRQKPRHLWLTGHSLGGALAVVCAHDLIDNEGAEVRGVMTFGQPMVAGDQLAVHLDKTLLGRYAHFVNGSDIVARVPPFLKHCGSLVWFTGGEVRRSKPKRPVYGAGEKGKGPPVEDVLPPLSEREFEKAKADVRKAMPKKHPDDLPTYGGIPLLDDHSMDLYLEKIRKINGGTGALIPPERKEGK